MLFKQLILAVTITCASYRVRSRFCNSVVVIPGASCNDTAEAHGIDTNRLIEYNPGLNCSAIENGQEVCIDLGVLPGKFKNNILDDVNRDINNTQALVNETNSESDLFEAFPPVADAELAPDELLKKAPHHWDTPTPVDGSSCVAYGVRHYTSRIRGVSSRKKWQSACKKTEITYLGTAVVEDGYFDKPSQCQNQGISGEYGYFDLLDSTCGTPPCPDHMAWDYKYGVCMPCTWDGKTPPNLLTNQLEVRRDLATREKSLWSHILGTSGNRLRYIDAALQKRVGECPAFNSPGGVTVVMPNNPAAWQNEHGEGPTAEYIANDPGVREAFQIAWDASYPSATTEQERGGFIFLDRTTHALTVRQVPVDTNPGLSAVIDRHNPAEDARLGINLNNPGVFSANRVLVANFHTHPGSIDDGLGDDPSIPSEEDNSNAWYRGVPGIIVHANGLTAYGPLARAVLSAPRGYPNTQQPAPNKEDPGRKIQGWVPTHAPYQRRATLF